MTLFCLLLANIQFHGIITITFCFFFASDLDLYRESESLDNNLQAQKLHKYIIRIFLRLNYLKWLSMSNFTVIT